VLIYLAYTTSLVDTEYSVCHPQSEKGVFIQALLLSLLLTQVYQLLVSMNLICGLNGTVAQAQEGNTVTSTKTVAGLHTRPLAL
jgi:hypothetical protein